MCLGGGGGGDKPCQFHGVTQGNDVEEQVGIRVAVDAVDDCHGCAHTLLGGADDDRDDVLPLLGRPHRWKWRCAPHTLPLS